MTAASRNKAIQTPGLDLAALLKEARINEEKLIHLQTMEVKLLNSDNFYEVCRILIDDYRRQFNLRAVTLTLIDRGRQLHVYLDENRSEDSAIDLDTLEKNVFFVSDYEKIRALQQFPHEPILAENADDYADFFGEYAEDVESAAILPLERRGELIGFLGLGSVDPGRYSPEMATDFISRLAAIVAVCVQNAIHLEQVKLMGLVDSLTQVRNRRYFFKRMAEELKRAQRSGEVVSCLYIDIDHFKQVNDEYGHTAGDVALMHAANLLDQVTRDSDVVARVGGEEFGVILPATSEQGARGAAERILEAFRREACELGRSTSVPMTVSIGLACCDASESIAEPAVLCSKLVDQADKALYQAKHRGRDCLVVYHPV